MLYGPKARTGSLVKFGLSTMNRPSSLTRICETAMETLPPPSRSNWPASFLMSQYAESTLMFCSTVV